MKEYELPEITEEEIELEDIIAGSGDVGTDPIGGTDANIFGI